MIEAARRALAGLRVPVFDSVVADEDLQNTYVLLLAPNSGRGGQEALSGGPSQVPLTVRAVGVTPAQVRVLLMSTREALRGLHVVSGVSRWAFHWDGSPRDIQVDRQIKNKLGTFPVFLDDEYTVFME